MLKPPRAAVSNRLLQTLPPDDFAWLEPQLALVTLALGEVLIKANTPITHVHFLEHGIVSLIAVAADGKQIEIGLIGREGLVGTPVLLGSETTPNEARVQASGLAYVMKADALRVVVRSRPELHDHLLRFTQTLNTQVASTALANGCFKLEQRLARWLLMCHDRSNDDVLPTTHRFLSLMLGVNRPGLTLALGNLERSGIVETRRGTITICDRAALLAIAGTAYGVPEAEYERLFAGSTDSCRP